MSTHGEAVSIDLKAVAQARLNHSLTTLDLAQKSMSVGKQVVVDISRVSCDHGTKQKSTEPGCRITGQDHVTE